MTEEPDFLRAMYENCARGFAEVVGYDPERGPLFAMTELGVRHVEEMPENESDIEVPEWSEQHRVLLALAVMAALKNLEDEGMAGKPEDTG